MPYSSTEVLKQFVKAHGDGGAGNKCKNISEIYSYLNGMTIRDVLKLNSGKTDISNGHKVIDVIAIGMDFNSLPGRKLDPVIMSLDYYKFNALNLKADTTIAETSNDYYGSHQPMHMNFHRNLKLPGTQIKFSELTACNAYISDKRGLAFCGPVSWTNTSHKNNDYWSGIEQNLANYPNKKDDYDANMTELSALFYTTDIIDHLQIRLGYRMPDHNDMYHWSNWLVASSDGNGGTGSRYYKLMYLTEFDYYMHGGVMADPSKLDSYLCKSAEFSEMIAQIIDPSSQRVLTSNDMQYYCTNTLTKGSILPAGQFIYSKDYKFKLHLTHGGNLNVWEFPILDDDINKCKAKMLEPKSWAVRPDVTPTCYVAIQPDGNIVVAGNPKNAGMYGDINYKSTLDSFGDHSSAPPSFHKSCSESISKPNYIFQCVNSNGNINTYPIIKDEYWTNNNGTGYMRDLNENGANGRLYENYGDTENDSRNTIFRCSTNKNDDNSYGTGGKNTWKAVINLSAPAGYTKEPMYLWRNQFGAERKLLYAVFKRNAPTFKSDDIRNRAIIISSNFRNSLSPKNTKDFSGLSDRQLYAILNCTTNRKAVELINSYTNSSNNDFNNGGQQYLPFDIISASNTAGNIYFAMSDYRVIVNNGGTIMAVNAGRMDKLGSDQVGYITESGASQWKYTENKYDLECIHGWKYIKTDGTGMVDLKQIVDLTKQVSESKNWCYRNPFLIYTDSDGTMYKFGATNMQQVLWIIGNYQNNIDTIYEFLTSNFMSTAKSKGYNNVNDSNDVNDMNSANGRLIATNYCMRGDRWLNNATCKTMALRSQNSTLPASLKRVIDFDIRTRICANPSNTPERNLCAVVKPSGLSDVETSLLTLDPNFAYAFDGVATGTTGSVNYTGAYGITETASIKSIDTLFNTIRDTIAKNANSLTEAQLLYLRKFYTTSNPSLDGQVYDNIRTFAHKTDYLSGEGALRYSPDGKYYLIFQPDGNLVARQNIAGTPAVWNSATSQKPNSTLAIQSDGNVVIYHNGSPIWNTGTSGSTDPTVLTIDNNGIVVLLRFNGIWSPVWTSNELKNYKTFSGAIITNTNRIDKSLWFPMYQRAAKLDALTPRTDITYPSPPSMGLIYYRNSNGIIIGWLPSFDTNKLKAKGTPKDPKDPNTFSPDSNLWKYFLGTLDINFPKQLIPLTHEDLVKTRDPTDSILPLITSASSPYERQIWTMDNTKPGNVLVYRLIDDAALIKYNRELKKTLADTDFKSMCGKNLNTCITEYNALVATDTSAAYPNAVCDVAIIGSGLDTMKTDANYNNIIKAYTTSGGFGNNRNTANVIVGNFMSKNGIVGNPQGFTDSQIYAILVGNSNPSGELNGLSGLFSADNAKTIAATCNNTFGVKTCSDGKLRYPTKSSFSNHVIGGSKSKFTSRVELFSGSNCLDICNNVNAPQNIKDACKTGAIDYCSKGENIFGPDCTKDSTLNPTTNTIKYPELVDIRTKWCTDNQKHANYLKNGCPPLVEVTPDKPIQTGSNQSGSVDANPTGSNGPTQQAAATDDSSGMGIGAILGIIVAILFAIVMVGIGLNKRRAASAATKTSLELPAISTPPISNGPPLMSTGPPPMSSEPSISAPSPMPNGPSISTPSPMPTGPTTASNPPMSSGPTK